MCFGAIVKQIFEAQKQLLTLIDRYPKKTNKHNTFLINYFSHRRKTNICILLFA